MKNKLKSILIPIILSAFWGILTYLTGHFVFASLPLASPIFYPILFGGIALVAATIVEPKIPIKTALIVGLLTGFIYQILSPIFPLLSSVIAGASLGGGLIADEGKLGDIFNRLVSIIKGVFIFPIFIYIGGLVSGITGGIFDSNFFLWFFWGGWIGLAICLVSIPVFRTDGAEHDPQTHSEVDEFKSEAQEILSGLKQLDSRVR